MEKDLKIIQDALHQFKDAPIESATIEESGFVLSLDSGIARIKGLPHVKNLELIEFPGNVIGMAFNLDPKEVGVILLGDYTGIRSGDVVKRTYQVASIPVSLKYLGRILDPLGNLLDKKEPVWSKNRLPLERESPPIMHRAPVREPLQTGIKVIDAIVPMGRGQRELILGDRQSGKTAIALDTIINQKGKDVLCVYCSIGQQISSLAKNLEHLRQHDSLAHTVVMVASADDPPGLAYIAPYAATSIAEYYMAQGYDVLIVYDDLTRHARAYRELSILLERPSGREAYPGDVFYIHSRLLERSTHLKPEFGGGSITALPIIETQAENISAYIPTNLISITDGQIYLSPKIFQRGNIPAINIGTSVSRVGGQSQLAAYREITGPLKLSYAQFEELELFSRFSATVDESTKKIFQRGERIRQVFNQPQFRPMEVTQQIGIFLCLTEGLFDDIEISLLSKAQEKIQTVVDGHEAFQENILSDTKLTPPVKDSFLEQAKTALKQVKTS